MNHQDARTLLQEHLDWIISGCPSKPDLRVYRDRVEEALLKIQEPEIKPPIVQRIEEVAPDAQSDDIAEFLEIFTDGAEYGEYMQALSYMWRHNWQYADENTALKPAMEQELRHHADHIYDEWRLVTTFSANGIEETDYVWLYQASDEVRAIAAAQLDAEGLDN